MGKARIIILVAGAAMLLASLACGVSTKSVDTDATPAPAVTTTATITKAAGADYLEGQAFSRKGLISQLKFEGYPEKTATAAVDSLHTDWNAQAALVAKDYLNGQSFSRKGLISQLKFEGFTATQATYGATKAGL
jgi:hypothetical protein